MLSRLRSLLLGLAGSPDLRAADGVISLGCIGIVGTAAYMAMVYYARTHPEIAPFLDEEALQTIFFVQTRIALPGMAGFLVVGLLAKKRWPDSRLGRPLHTGTSL